MLSISKNEKICEVCGAGLCIRNTRDLARKRFCSTACKYASQQGHLAVPTYKAARICERCGIDYIATAKKQQYCSTRCAGYVAAIRALKKSDDLYGHIKRLLRYPGRRHLSVDFILALYRRQNGRCALSGEELTWGLFRGKVGTTLSIDRISSDVGYTEDNIQLISLSVNIMKNKTDQDDFLVMCRRIAEFTNAK